MNTVEGPWPSKDRFVNFCCPRCQVTTRHVPARAGWKTLLVLCPSCRSAYSVTGHMLLGAALGLFIVVPGALALAFSYFVRASIPPWALVLAAAAVTFLVLPIVKPALSRLLLSYEYVGHAT